MFHRPVDLTLMICPSPASTLPALTRPPRKLSADAVRTSAALATPRTGSQVHKWISKLQSQVEVR